MTSPEVEPAGDRARTQLRRRLLIALATPLFVLIAVGAVLALQVSKLSENTTWLDQTNKIIAKTYEVQTLILDQETGIRGYLLSDEREFLQPYENAKPLAALDELRALVMDRPDQRVRVTELRKRYQYWASSAASAVGDGRAEAYKSASLRARKQSMDDVRVAVGAIIEAERVSREDQAAIVAASNTRTRYVLAAL
ncbi:MAG TPA: CHASE3 domain-containing protein, partial [Polyangiaceae bacterium]|nr:CHASE3 domain-containing protein [Polyangiaceae bacterium]